MRINGYFSLIMYCIITAISFLSIHNVTQTADPTVAMIYTFLIAVSFFHILNFKHLTKMYHAFRHHFKIIFSINVATMIIWFGTFWSLKFITPVLFVTLFLGATPLISVIFNMFSEKKINALTILFVSTILLLISALIIMRQLTHPEHTEHLFLGISLALLSGGTLSWYFYNSRLLNQRAHFEATQVLAIRFHLTLLIGSLSLFYPLDTTKFVTGISMEYMLLLALVSIILPLFSLQTGLHKLGPLKTALIIQLTPVFTYLIELATGFSFHFATFSIILLLSLTLALASRLKI